MSEEKLGYLIAKVEELGEDMRELKGKYNALEQRVDEKFKTAEATFRVLKILGLITIAVLSFKFGDLPSLWRGLF